MARSRAGASRGTAPPLPKVRSSVPAESSVRSSSTSSCGRNSFLTHRREGLLVFLLVPPRFSHLANVLWNIASSGWNSPGLRYNENAIAPGAQTRRPAEAGPVSRLLGGEDSLAAFLS